MSGVAVGMAGKGRRIRRGTRLSRPLEAAFRTEDVEHRRQQAVWGMVLGLCCYLGLLGIDWLVVPDVANLDAVLRMTVGVPVGIAAIAVLIRPGLPSLLYQGVVAAFGLACVVTIDLAMSRSVEPAGLAYFSTGLVVMCFTINLVGMNPVAAGLACIAITLVTSLASAASSYGSTGVVVTHLVFSIMVSIVATFANWCLLNQRRHAFAMCRQGEEQVRQIAEQRDLLERIAMVDALTGLPNRRGFDAMVANDLSAADAGSALVVAMIDVDCFKAFNDGYGHPAGDTVLRTVAEALQACCGQAGGIGRLGGEEFGLILSGPDAERLQDTGDRLCGAVEACGIIHPWNEAAAVVTVSVGLAGGTVRPGQNDCVDLFSRADRALYEAKRSGRNRAVVADA